MKYELKKLIWLRKKLTENEKFAILKRKKKQKKKEAKWFLDR